MRDAVSRDGAEFRRRTKVTLAVTLGLILVIGSVVGWGAAECLINLEDQGPSVTLPETGKLKKENKSDDGVEAKCPGANGLIYASSGQLCA